MAGIYVDTSAIGRVLLGEPDAEAIVEALADYEVWWSSGLLAVELRRLGRREGLEPAAERTLARMRMLDVDRNVLERASRLDPVEVRTLDAIHLDAAVTLATRGEISAVLTYDRQLQAGCVHHGLAVKAPTAI